MTCYYGNPWPLPHLTGLIHVVSILAQGWTWQVRCYRHKDLIGLLCADQGYEVTMMVTNGKYNNALVSHKCHVNVNCTILAERGRQHVMMGLGVTFTGFILEIGQWGPSGPPSVILGGPFSRMGTQERSNWEGLDSSNCGIPDVCLVK